jgi:hypothetical protein
MRFEEVSATVESRIIAATTALVLSLSNDLHAILGVFNSTRDDVVGAIHSLDAGNVTLSAARAIAPGGLTSVLIATALLLRLLQYALVQRRAARLMGIVGAFAKAEGNGGAAHPKTD